MTKPNCVNDGNGNSITQILRRTFQCYRGSQPLILPSSLPPHLLLMLSIGGQFSLLGGVRGCALKEIHMLLLLRTHTHIIGMLWVLCRKSNLQEYLFFYSPEGGRKGTHHPKQVYMHSSACLHGKCNVLWSLCCTLYGLIISANIKKSLLSFCNHHNSRLQALYTLLLLVCWFCKQFTHYSVGS